MGANRKVRQIEFRELPLDFWDKVIYYEYFISFSGFVEAEPQITLWTTDGSEYYINEREFRDGRFERVIPFFDLMADKKAIEEGNVFYFNWDLVPEGWNYYYHNSNHCFIPDSVYEEFSSHIDDIEKFSYDDKDDESVSDKIVRFIIWKEFLKQAYQNALGVTINEDIEYYIRFDERIHVYSELYVGKRLNLHQLTKSDADRLKSAVAWSIEYTTPFEHTRNLVYIVVYFDKDEPLIIDYEFDRKEQSNYMDEHEFMKLFMDVFDCDLGNREKGYSFKNPIEGFKPVQNDDEPFYLYWIRNNVYMANYHNVIEPFINYSGNSRFLQTPICGCKENKEGYIELDK